jgi:hypothetical protein
MNTRRGLQRLAAATGLLGGALGVLAGVVQAAAGTHIPDLTGNKGSPVALGLLTVFLSGCSIFFATQLRITTPMSSGRRVVAAIGLLVPGALCFSTAGALWYLPGVVLLLAGGLTIAAGDAKQTRAVIATGWLPMLVSALGGFELLMAVSAGSPMAIAVGVIGGLVLVAAPWVSAARLAVVLMVVGTLPFAILTWSSLASPLLGVVALAIGFTVLRRQPRRADVG